MLTWIASNLVPDQYKRGLGIPLVVTIANDSGGAAWTNLSSDRFSKIHQW